MTKPITISFYAEVFRPIAPKNASALGDPGSPCKIRLAYSITDEMTTLADMVDYFKKQYSEITKNQTTNLHEPAPLLYYQAYICKETRDKTQEIEPLSSDTKVAQVAKLLQSNPSSRLYFKKGKAPSITNLVKKYKSATRSEKK